MMIVICNESSLIKTILSLICLSLLSEHTCKHLNISIIFKPKTNQIFVNFRKPKSNDYLFGKSKKVLHQNFKGKYNLDFEYLGKVFLWCNSILELAIQCKGVVTFAPWWHTYRYPLSVWKKTYQHFLVFSFFDPFYSNLEVSIKFFKDFQWWANSVPTPDVRVLAPKRWRETR